MKRWLTRLLLSIAVLGGALLLAGRLGLLAGSEPADLGVQGGRLKAPSTTPNSVSSQAALWVAHPRRTDAGIAPLPLRGDAADAIARLQPLAAAMPGARVVRGSADYLYVQCTSRWLGFVDDVEFWVDPAAGVIHVRSASRIGHGDRGVNRARIEALRAAWMRPDS
ncbi:DUF1499 domain-containing protein [Rubrivivax sp. RP6-9]|uniref:DUF1499 domain-containing protein n=1 Tax=Rubrivivax sp. RP6-9 TaxID=3415750 RepID=UPI003CC5B744